jgi:two-component system sensor histidine kinase KdpD
MDNEAREDPSPLASYAMAGLGVVASLAAALALEPVAGLENVDLVFLVGVIAVASRYGPGPALASCVASVLAYNFFFLPPLYTLAISEPKHVLALILFLLAALITSNMAAIARVRARQVRQRSAITEQLYAFSRALAQLTTQEEVARTTAEAAGRLLAGDGTVLVADGAGAPQVGPPSVLARRLEDFELAALAGPWPGSFPGAQARLLRLGNGYFVPMETEAGRVGVLGLSRTGEAMALAPQEERMLQSLADQAAVALSRIRLAAERDEAQVTAERERLRSSLLNSLSHDLKTPLASILGAVTALRAYGPSYDEAQREELIATMEEEARRMERFVTNLLDMTRLEAGALSPRREPTDIGEVIGAALAKTAPLTREHQVDLRLGHGLPLFDLDPVLLEQVIANLVENAAKFAPPGSAIRVTARPLPDGGVEIGVADSGPGIPEAERERVFDLFYQVRAEDHRPAGSGVGLSICRGFVEALGGTIEAAAAQPGAGAAFLIRFPASAALAAAGALA